jgi:phenylalanyl-tRNA synthetase alpha chain
VVGALLPGRSWTTTPTSHPYTLDGRQIDVGGTEIGECGVAHPELTRGLAMGIGLDRVFMLRKGIDDIRLLRSTDPRVASQMLDLEPYRPVSKQPAAWRDLSIATGESDLAEDLGDRVRAALGKRASLVEEVTILSETPYSALPEAARARLGIRPGQKNVALRVVLRDLERSLPKRAASALRDEVYAALHQGTVFVWAVPRS